ncbi:hypothetical protein N7468_003377 [Penicillium chermesinum]|uniref:Uncharacterized protein n=1 Tax=Penicillium chermesinum TaxID=63820 RepID=A0A9W9P6B7_9EURO|nr:uncharacterized protein N7468_003377 [Penicillium chermesinum]KAJ5238758.1 hypothetical protein N7468_003377 [Penicillium chermesinum]
MAASKEQTSYPSPMAVQATKLSIKTGLADTSEAYCITSHSIALGVSAGEMVPVISLIGGRYT